MRKAATIWTIAGLLGLGAVALFWQQNGCVLASSAERALETAKAAAAPEASDMKTTAEGTSSTEKSVFNSPLAGRWYEGDAEQLAAEIDDYLETAEVEPLEGVQGLILPHAGYRFSGQVAAYGVKQASSGAYDRVIVMGPSHRVPMENLVSVTTHTSFVTPLGEVPIDVEFVKALKAYPHFRAVPGTDEEEHSVQIQLPLLQRALGTFKFVPLVVGDVDVETTRAIADALLGLIDSKTLVVASTDFTHYGPNYGYVPFRDDVQENIEKLDMGAWAFVEKHDLTGFLGYVKKTGATICGRCPVGILVAMLPDTSQAHLLKYDTSGRMIRDVNSVSYLSAAFTGSWPEREPAPAEASAGPTLTDEDKAQLLTLARATLKYYLEHREIPEPDDFGIKVTPGMERVMGAFVTLKKHGQLRGCIGDIFPRRPLYKAVMDNAVNSGVNDYRFQPVALDELPSLSFEISALTPPVPVDSYKDIVIGKHGMFIEKAGRRAVYLPQVAPEQGWDIDETLSHLSLKAGLNANDWREGAKFTVFEAIVFHEKG